MSVRLTSRLCTLVFFLLASIAHAETCDLELNRIFEENAQLIQLQDKLNNINTSAAQRLKKYLQALDDRMMQHIDQLSEHKKIPKESLNQLSGDLERSNILSMAVSDIETARRLANPEHAHVAELLERHVIEQLDRLEKGKKLNGSTVSDAIHTAESLKQTSGMKIEYENPGHHDPNKAGAGRRGGGESNTSKLPDNHEQLWKNAIPGDPADKNWWAYDPASKLMHRFTARKHGGKVLFHWNGSSAKGPLKIQDQDIPGHVRRMLNP